MFMELILKSNSPELSLTRAVGYHDLGVVRVISVGDKTEFREFPRCSPVS